MRGACLCPPISVGAAESKMVLPFTGWAHMLSRDRLTVLLTVLTIFLFQTHWVDDLGTGDSDLPGITVAAIGGMLLATGLLLRRRGVGVAVLVLGFLFVGLVSAADLRGLDTTGTAAPDILTHWRDGLGWGFTLAVALTLALSVAGMAVLLTNVRLGVSRQTPRAPARP